MAEPSLKSQLREFERATIVRCLLETGGNVKATLERLKIPRRTLNEKMRRLGIYRGSRLLEVAPCARSSVRVAGAERGERDHDIDAGG